VPAVFFGRASIELILANWFWARPKLRHPYPWGRRGLHTTPLQGQELQRAIQLLFDVTLLLDEHLIPYHLEGGTLLGLVRDGHLIPWDHDLDISVPAPYFKRVLKVLRKLPILKWRRRVRKTETETVAWEVGRPRLIKIKDRHRRLPFLREELCLDIFIKHHRDGFVYWQTGSHLMQVNKRFYESHDVVEFAGRLLKTPNHYEEYLSLKYGDWKTPRKLWHFSQEGTIISSGHSVRRA